MIPSITYENDSKFNHHVNRKAYMWIGSYGNYFNLRIPISIFNSSASFRKNRENWCNSCFPHFIINFGKAIPGKVLPSSCCGRSWLKYSEDEDCHNVECQCKWRDWGFEWPKYIHQGGIDQDAKGSCQNYKSPQFRTDGLPIYRFPYGRCDAPNKNCTVGRWPWSNFTLFLLKYLGLEGE